MTTILTAIVAILSIVLLPGYIYVKVCNNKKSKAVFACGIFISIFGCFISEWLCNTFQLSTNYQNSRLCVFWVMFVLTLNFGVLYKASENDPDRSFALRLYLCIAAVLLIVTVIFAPYVPLKNGLSDKEIVLQREAAEKEALYLQNVKVTTYTQTEKFELLSFKLEDNNEENDEEVEKTEDSKIFLGLDRDNYILYWCFFYKNDKGAIEMECLDGEDLSTTKISETLESSEEPYLQVVSTVEVKTDNNYSPARVTENVIKTEYHLHTPKDYLPETIYLNFN